MAARGLDTLGGKTYSAAMFRKSVASLFIALWFILFAIEFSEDMGFIDYDEAKMDYCVEATLASLGEAIKISDDLQLTVPCPASPNPVAFYPSIASQKAPSQLLGERIDFVKAGIPIYSLHQVFLI